MWHTADKPSSYIHHQKGSSNWTLRSSKTRCERSHFTADSLKQCSAHTFSAAENVIKCWTIINPAYRQLNTNDRDLTCTFSERWLHVAESRPNLILRSFVTMAGIDVSDFFGCTSAYVPVRGNIQQGLRDMSCSDYWKNAECNFLSISL